MLYDISSGSLKLHLPFPLIILEIFFVYLEFFYFFDIGFVFVLEDNLVSMDVSQTQIILTTHHKATLITVHFVMLVCSLEELTQDLVCMVHSLYLVCLERKIGSYLVGGLGLGLFIYFLELISHMRFQKFKSCLQIRYFSGGLVRSCENIFEHFNQITLFKFGLLNIHQLRLIFPNHV